MAVTHHLSSQDNRNGSYQLLIKTPSHRGPTSMGIGPMSRKANRTGGLKTPRTFSIYTDGENQMTRGGGDTFDMEEPQKLFSKADLPSLANPPRSAANKMLNPLADKTNTVKKSRSRNNAGTQSPTPAKKSSASIKPNSILKTSLSSKAVKDLGQATPHLKKSVRLQPPNWNGFNKEPDSVQRLLYRTPVTSKRAHRPPVAFDTSLEISEETDEYNETSLVGYSDRLGGLSFSLGDQDMPDAEYGPPTALVEPIEAPEKNYQFADFISLLKDPSFQSKFLELESTEEDQECVKLILNEDGQKKDWVSEAVPQLNDSENDLLFDDLLFPIYPTQSLQRRLGAGPTRFIKNSAARPHPETLKSISRSSSYSTMMSRSYRSSGNNADQKDRKTRSTILNSSLFNSNSGLQSLNRLERKSSSSLRSKGDSVGYVMNPSQAIRENYREIVIRDLIKLQLERDEDENLAKSSVGKVNNLVCENESLSLSFLSEFRFTI